MSASHLAVVSSPGAVASAGGRIRQLQAEARALALEQVEALGSALSDVARLATEVAEGGELYPVGARELARRVAEDAAKQSLTLSIILDRV